MQDKASVLADLARRMARQDVDSPLANRLCLSAIDLLGVSGVALTIAYTGAERVTLCATDDHAARLEDLQDVLGQGPGPAVYRTGQYVDVVLGTGDDERWPELAQAVRDQLGPTRVHALPVRPHDEVLGVLTCHQPPQQDLRLEPPTAQFLADAIGVALLHDPTSHELTGSSPWMSRTAVHQATGMVMAQLRVNGEDALALLRAHAFAADQSLLEISASVVRRELDFGQDNGKEEGSR